LILDHEERWLGETEILAKQWGRVVADDDIGSSASRGRTRFSGVSYPSSPSSGPVVSFTGSQTLPIADSVRLISDSVQYRIRSWPPRGSESNVDERSGLLAAGLTFA